VNAIAAQGLLESWGCRVTWVDTGTKALKAIEKDDFDLLLMNISMPEMDGIETTRRIRQRETTTGKRLPIIALTAHTSSHDRDLCFQAGMDDFLTKPINAEGMLERLWFWQGSCPWPRK
jgi:CheY-like chemotaxis protein